MARVRNEAKANMRRFVDDVSFVVSKESPPTGSRGFSASCVTTTVGSPTDHRSLNESLQASLAAANSEENDAPRGQELERQLNILRQVTETRREPVAQAGSPAGARWQYLGNRSA